MASNRRFPVGQFPKPRPPGACTVACAARCAGAFHLPRHSQCPNSRRGMWSGTGACEARFAAARDGPWVGCAGGGGVSRAPPPCRSRFGWMGVVGTNGHSRRPSGGGGPSEARQGWRAAFPASACAAGRQTPVAPNRSSSPAPLLLPPPPCHRPLHFPACPPQPPPMPGLVSRSLHPDPENRTHANARAFPSVPQAFKSVSKQEKFPPRTPRQGPSTHCDARASACVTNASECVGMVVFFSARRMPRNSTLPPHRTPPHVRCNAVTMRCNADPC